MSANGRRAARAAHQSGGARARAAWVLGGQGFSSGSNFLLTALVLATAPRAQFATFSLSLTAVLLLVQLSRSAVSVPVVLAHAGAARSHPDYRGALGAVSVLGVVAATAMALLAWAAGPYLVGARQQFAILAIVVVPLLLQDSLRHLAFAEGRPQLATLSDGVWIVLQVAASAVVLRNRWGSPASLLAVWAGAGAIAGGFIAIALRTYPLPWRAAGWLRANGPVSARLVVELGLTSGSYYLLYYGLGLVAGVAQIGRFRAAQTLFGPMSVLLLGGTALGLPESVRAKADAARLRRLAMILSVALAAGSLITGALVVATLPWFGPNFFPNSWATARPLIPMLSIYGAAVGASAGATAALRALDQSTWILKGRVASGALSLIAGLLLAGWLGAGGAFAGLVMGEWLFATRAWWRFAHLAAPGRPDQDRRGETLGVSPPSLVAGC